MHFLSTQNLPKTKIVLGHYYVSLFDTMAAYIEKSLAKILEDMKEIKDYILDFEARNMRTQQSPISLPPDTAYNLLFSIKNRWIAFDTSFFDPHFNGKLIDIAEAIKYLGKDTYYYNIFVFLDRIKDYAKTRSPKLVHQNFSSCFREIALA